jgi:hypothetical protein
MADIKKSDIVIEGTTASWSIHMEGDVSGTFNGTFRFKCFLTPTERIAANREMRALLGEHPMLVPEHESFLAYALTQLKYRIITAPPFWKSGESGWAGDLPDSNVISEVLNAAVEAEVKYKDELNKRKLEHLDRAKKAAEAILNRGLEDDQVEEEEAE